jgi:hypothetical protein
MAGAGAVKVAPGDARLAPGFAVPHGEVEVTPCGEEVSAWPCAAVAHAKVAATNIGQRDALPARILMRRFSAGIAANSSRGNAFG